MPLMHPRNCSHLLVSTCCCFPTMLTWLTWLEEPQAPPVTNAASGGYGAAWMRDSIKARKTADSSKINPLHELNSYLKAPLEEVEDIIGWWGVRCIPSFSDQPSVLIILASLIAIPNAISHCKRLSCHPGLSCTIRTRLLEQRHHRCCTS